MLTIQGSLTTSTVTSEVSPDNGVTALDILDQAGTAINAFTAAGAISQFSFPATLQVRATITGGSDTGITVQLH